MEAKHWSVSTISYKLISKVTTQLKLIKKTPINRREKLIKSFKTSRKCSFGDVRRLLHFMKNKTKYQIASKYSEAAIELVFFFICFQYPL